MTPVRKKLKKHHPIWLVKASLTAVRDVLIKEILVVATCKSRILEQDMLFFITATFLLLNSQFDNPDLRGAQACVLAFSCVDRESFKQVELDPYLRALLLGSMYFWSWLIQLYRSYKYNGKIARTGISTLNGHIWKPVALREKLKKIKCNY